MLHQIDFETVRQFPDMAFMARQVVEGFITGLHKSPFHGFSVEFSEHKPYNVGQSVRNIDWRLFARSDKLFIKKFEEETNLRCQIVIDGSSSMYFPSMDYNKMVFSVYGAAVLMELLKQQRDAFGLSIFSEQTNLHTPCRSSLTHQKLLLNYLENTLNQPKTHNKTSTVSALHQIAELVHKRSLIVIFSDILDAGGINADLFAALQHLKYKKNEVVLFYTIDKRLEMDFEYGNQPHEFTDMETNEKVLISNPKQIQAQYTKTTSEFRTQIAAQCIQYGIEFVEVDIAKGFYDVLLTYMVKRNKMV